jgi:ribosome biogenesis protein BRX1
MAPLLTAQKAYATKLDVRGKGKRKADDINVDDDDVQQPKQKRNKQRVLLLSSRGITHRMRHLMNDLETLLPHVKKGKVMFLLAVSSHWDLFQIPNLIRSHSCISYLR